MRSDAMYRKSIRINKDYVLIVCDIGLGTRRSR